MYEKLGTNRRGVVAGHLHDLIGKSALAQQAGHGLHRRVDMTEEGFVAGAEVIEARLAVRGRDEPVARTLNVAGEQDVAFAAVFGLAVQLVLPERALLHCLSYRAERG